MIRRLGHRGYAGHIPCSQNNTSMLLLFPAGDAHSPSSSRGQQTKAKQQAAAAAAGNAADVAPMRALSHITPACGMQRVPAASTANQRGRSPPASSGLLATLTGAEQQQAELPLLSTPSRGTSIPMLPDSSSIPAHLLGRPGRTLQSELPASNKQQGRVSTQDRHAQTQELLDAQRTVPSTDHLHTGSIAQRPRSAAGSMQRSAQSAGGPSPAAAAPAAMQDEQQQQRGKQRLQGCMDAAFLSLKATAGKQAGAAAAAAGGSSGVRAVGGKRGRSPNPVVAGLEALPASELLHGTAGLAYSEDPMDLTTAGTSQATSKRAAFKVGCQAN
jgi:hypothetical protein